jgi:hypothetical protein
MSPDVEKFTKKAKSRLHSKQYVYRKFEKDFNDNVVMPDIEHKNQVLESIRMRNKSFAVSELQDHESKTSEI